MIDGSVLQSAQRCFEKKSRVVVKMVVTALPSTLPEPKETISVISQRLTKKKQTVFLALQGNIVNFWVIRNENKIELRQTQTGGRKGREDSIPCCWTLF